jgi:hypothetical protein
MKMTKPQAGIWIAVLALVPATGAAQMCGGGHSGHSGSSTHESNHHEEEPSAAAVADAITEYVQQDIKLHGGYFLVYDAERKASVSLTLDRVRDERLQRVGDRKYFTCADFESTDGETYDLDFFVKQSESETDRFEVKEIAVHAQNGVLRYLWQEKGDNWKRIPISPDERASTGGAQADVAESRYVITVDNMGFSPDFLSVQQGSDVTLVVTRKTDQTCAKEIVIPSLDIRKELPLDQPVEIVLSPDKKGNIRFACGMDMFTGVIRVE